MSAQQQPHNYAPDALHHCTSNLIKNISTDVATGCRFVTTVFREMSVLEEKLVSSQHLQNG